MRHVADRPGLTAGQIPDPGSIELLVDLLLLHRLTQLLVLPDGHDHRYHLAAMVNHIVGVTGGHLAHENHGNEADRQSDVTTRRRSTTKAEADPSSQMAFGATVSTGPVLRGCGGAGVSRRPRPWRRGGARP